MARPSKRQSILHAAAAIAGRDGVAAVTLDAVAAEAGVSKGGLLYHFPTKNALIAAVQLDVIMRFERTVFQRAADDPRPAALAHAYVDATFFDDFHPELLHALLEAPDLAAERVHHVIGLLDDWEKRLVEAGLDAGTAAIIRHACDGWWLTTRLRSRGGRDSGAALRHRLHDVIEEVMS